MVRVKRLLWVLPIVIGLIIYGNNCSVRRLTSENSQTTETNLGSTTPDTPTVTTPSSGFKISSKDDVDACIGDNLNYEVLPNCLTQKGLVSDEQKTLLAESISQCNSEKSNKVFMGLCLASKGIVVDRYRSPQQIDFNKCAAKVGESKLAACLNKNGLLPLGITQVEIDSCLTAVGLAKLEVCFRKRGYIAANGGVVAQFDVSLCQKLGATDIYDCLLNSGLVPAAANSTDAAFVGQFVKADLDTCISQQSATINSINCLRIAGKLSRVTLFHHLDRCRSLVGTSKIVACLTANGVSLTSGAVTLNQGMIDACVADRGFENVMTCLRNDFNVFSKVVSQAEIIECNRYGGANNLASCLYRNGILPTGLTQVNINECVTAVAAGAATGATFAKCFRKKGFVSKALLQGDVNNCLRLVDPTKIATCLNANVAAIAPLVQDDVDSCISNANVGTPNLAKCLRNKGLIPKVLMQDHINGCANFAGVDNIAACLNANGFIDSAATVVITQDLIQTCIAGVGLANVRKCLVNKSALSKTVGADETQACTLFSGAAPDQLNACYTANGLVP